MLRANIDKDNSSTELRLSEAPFIIRSGEAIMHIINAMMGVSALVGSFALNDGISLALGNIILIVISVPPCRYLKMLI